ncbi:LysR substrate-binding domain-containing protein [Thiomonas arsenitoxydans]|uniref:LysR substrate-binding domain-containing protein n=1 Tax=Thiomonas arsenitoxydans (strain DSM 22701 / CIP 110005 / 3As) TaxID=426114 RepID=UPI001AD394A5|nr:LysR substrate-binding domain-containing protein [Thiomonas arsenitoxydans]MBN8776268.1 LysR family transcriptional regulator [Thiomonas arsenitoxydans]
MRKMDDGAQRQAAASAVLTPRSRQVDAGNLRGFEAAARLGSFTAAADALALTQSALSRQIQTLEVSVGVPLFVREGPRVRLSPAGEQFAVVVRQALQQLDAAVEGLRASQGRPRVQITTFASLASQWLIPRLGDFQSAHPDIDIAVETFDNLSDLEAGGLDIAIRRLRDDNPLARAPHTAFLFGEQITPVCSPALAQTGRAPGALDDLPRCVWIDDVRIHSAPPIARANLQALSWGGWYAGLGLPQPEPQRWLRFNYTYQVIQAAVAGQGVAMGQIGLIRDLLAAGTLIAPVGRRVDAGYGYYLAVRSGAQQRPEVAAMLDWLQQQFEAWRAIEIGG